jgi:hypothetical protein
MKKVQVKPSVAFAFPKCVTLNEQGNTIALTGGEFTEDVEGTATKPPQRRTIKAATQADLIYLFKKGHPFLEEVEDTAKEVKNG